MKANEQRGEIALTTDAGSYVLRLEINELCAMEAKSGRTFRQVLEGLRRGSTADARLLIWAALQPYHSEQAKTLEQAGEIMSRSGGQANMHIVSALIDRLIAVNQPSETSGSSETNQDPQPAQAGTGVNSTVTLVGSV